MRAPSTGTALSVSFYIQPVSLQRKQHAGAPWREEAGPDLRATNSVQSACFSLRHGGSFKPSFLPALKYCRRGGYPHSIRAHSHLNASLPPRPSVSAFKMHSFLSNAPRIVDRANLKSQQAGVKWIVHTSKRKERKMLIKETPLEHHESMHTCFIH